jgi:hypothetical protein
LSLKDFVETYGKSMIPQSHFVANPAYDAELRLETDLGKLPQELGSQIIIPTADPDLRRNVEARGFISKESNRTLIFMWRQLTDGVLRAQN